MEAWYSEEDIELTVKLTAMDMSLCVCVCVCDRLTPINDGRSAMVTTSPTLIDVSVDIS